MTNKIPIKLFINNKRQNVDISVETVDKQHFQEKAFEIVFYSKPIIRGNLIKKMPRR